MLDFFSDVRSSFSFSLSFSFRRLVLAGRAPMKKWLAVAPYSIQTFLAFLTPVCELEAPPIIDEGESSRRGRDFARVRLLVALQAPGAAVVDLDGAPRGTARLDARFPAPLLRTPWQDCSTTRPPGDYRPRESPTR